MAGVHAFLSNLAPEMAKIANEMELGNKLKESQQTTLQIILLYNLMTADAKFCSKKISDFVLGIYKRPEIIIKQVIIELELLGLSLTDAFSISPMADDEIKRLTNDHKYIIKRLQKGYITTFGGLFNEYKYIKEQTTRACSCCGKSYAQKKCSACFYNGSINVRYCDRVCQSQHWNMANDDSHKIYCFKHISA
jgi:hypothetical protein